MTRRSIFALALAPLLKKFKKPKPTNEFIRIQEFYRYQDGGHFFWVITFPTADATWVYDLTTGQWHQSQQKGDLKFLEGDRWDHDSKEIIQKSDDSPA